MFSPEKRRLAGIQQQPCPTSKEASRRLDRDLHSRAWKRDERWKLKQERFRLNKMRNISPSGMGAGCPEVAHLHPQKFSRPSFKTKPWDLPAGPA